MWTTISNLTTNLAIGMVMLFSGLQLWWAVDALQHARHVEAAGEWPAASQFMASNTGSSR